MSKSDNGGSAFPAHSNKLPGYFENQGMSLRDWFAGQVLTGMVTLTIEASHVRTDEEAEALIADTMTQRAEYAYRYADAMLKARSE